MTKLFKDFFESEKTGGLILVCLTIISLLLANSSIQTTYLSLWNFSVGGYSINHWINDGLMSIFFLLIGLELEREIYQGELKNIKNAALPVFGALGGMIVPAAFFLLFNFRSDTLAGAGIPMATDIAFAIGILSLLGKRVPATLKVFLTAFAIIDDLGAILVIAIFYTKTLIWNNLLIVLGIFLLLLIFNRLKIRNLIPYILGGIFMWYFMHHSGVHATITGILLAFVIPFGNGNEKSPSYILQHFLHKPVAFIILPLFALANTSIALSGEWYSTITENNSLGIITGLFLGKPIGIYLFALLGTTLGLCSLPQDLHWKNILSVGFLGGIGFTMSIFITLLAFDQENMITGSKVAILVASLISGLSGYLLLKWTLPVKTQKE